MSRSCESSGNEQRRMTGKEHRQPEAEDEGTFKGPTFFPPVYRQRYAAVRALVHKYKAKKVIDFGCSEGKLVRYLINEDSLTHMEILIGVDIDQDLLQQSEFRIHPLTADYLRPRSHPFKVGLYQGSIAEADERFIDFDLIACVEIIEHLEGDVLDAMPKALFGLLKPKVVLVTTPNVEFNVLFPGLQGFRHYDHKFEWTRAEFQQWAIIQGVRFGYTVTFDGIAPGPEGTEHLGCCSQLAVFERISSVADCTDASDIGQPYNLIAEVEHPFREDNTSKEEKILREVEYVLWVLSGSEMESDESNEQENGDDSDYDGKDDNYDDNGNNDDDDDDGDDDNDDNCHKKFSTNCTYSMNKADGPKLYPFERLLSFVSLHKLCDNIEDLRYVLETSSMFNLSKDGCGVLWQRPSEWSSDDSENEWDRIDAGKDLHTPISNATETSMTVPECWEENFSEAGKDTNFTRKERDVCWDSSDNISKFWNGKIWNESEDNETQGGDIEELSTMFPCCSLQSGLEESDSSFDADDNSDLVWIVAENELTVNNNSSV